MSALLSKQHLKVFVSSNQSFFYIASNFPAENNINQPWRNLNLLCAQVHIARLSPIRRLNLPQLHSQHVLESFYYNQTLDHFKQKYVIDFKYWGAELPFDDYVTATGFLTDNAPQFNALLVYMEVWMNTTLITNEINNTIYIYSVCFDRNTFTCEENISCWGLSCYCCWR